MHSIPNCIAHLPIIKEWELQELIFLSAENDFKQENV